MAQAMMKQWKVTSTDKGFDGLQIEDAPVPTLGEHEVLVEMYAVSLNYRDLMISRGEYPFPLDLPVVPCSDGAGQVLEVGNKVTRWTEGDRVVTLLHQAHSYGPMTPKIAQTSLGGSLDGTLRQYAVFNEQGVVHVPKNLNYREASSLSCAGVTSWNALYGLKPLRPGQTVLTLGTGGVSIFALQFAKAAGATIIATTSSNEKATLLKKLGAVHVVKYSDDPNWGQKVKNLTRDGLGVDHVIEVGGVGTLHQSLKAVNNEGVISVIGSVATGDCESLPTILDCWLNNCTARGVSVGSRVQMEAMVAAIEANDIHPVIDEKRFSMDQARDAFHFLASRGNLGKVVIDVHR